MNARAALLLLLALVGAVPAFALAAPQTATPAITPTAAPSTAAAARTPRPVEFRDAAEAHRFRALVAELRCVMCQNQSLADSDAMIAHDLRREILAMIRAGRSDAQIKQFLVARYSEFVLYRPAFGPRNWLLWLGPGLLLLGGAIVVWRIVRVQRARAMAPAGSAGIPPANGADDGQEW